MRILPFSILVLERERIRNVFFVEKGGIFLKGNFTL